MMQQSFAQKVFSPIQDNINQLEQMIGLRTLSHEESIPYQVILSSLESSCTSADIQSGQKKYNNFINNPANKNYFESKSIIKKKLKFNGIKNLIIRSSNQQDKVLCVQKYFLYKILQKVQNTDPFSYPFSISNNSTSLSSESQIFSHLAHFYIQDRIQQLMKERVFNASDMSQLDNKIIVNYVEQCGNVHGSYHMFISPSGEQSVSKIIININICTTPHYLSNFKKYVNQLFVHELGHYLYYFKDDTNQYFDNICRKNNKNICNSDDFVSTYAQSSKEEDYAESFTYRYLMVYNHNRPIPTSEDKKEVIVPLRISRKIEYFGKLYKVV